MQSFNTYRNCHGLFPGLYTLDVFHTYNDNSVFVIPQCSFLDLGSPHNGLDGWQIRVQFASLQAPILDGGSVWP